jgi:hypothetical protein
MRRRFYPAPLFLAAMLLFGASVWLEWPLLTLRTYPDVPLRAYAGMGVLIFATSILRMWERARIALLRASWSYPACPSLPLPSGIRAT